MESLELLEKAHLGLVGCGAMGSAMVSGWLEQPILKGGVSILTPHETSAAPFLKDSRVIWLAKPEQLKQTPDMLVFAVKPHQLAEILPLYQRFIDTGASVMTVAAGKSVKFYQDILGTKFSLIRAMPNTPAAVHRGVILAHGAETLTKAEKSMAQRLLSVLGDVFWFAQEADLDNAAALTSSGPAYVYRFVESLLRAGQALGLSETDAQDMAQKLLIGSAAYLEQSGKTPAELRQQVTSPGGMTQAALEKMDELGLDRVFAQALVAARDRSKEL